MTSQQNPLLILECSKKAFGYALFPSLTKNKELCCTAVANNWMTLNRNGGFDVCNSLNESIRKVLLLTIHST